MKLEAQDLRFSYASARPVLRDVSLTVESGTFTAVLGRNGCGKSTLLSLLVAARKPESGRVLLDGTPLDEIDRTTRARSMAFVAQHSHGHRMTVFDTVLLGRRPHMEGAPSDEDRAVVARVLDELGLGAFALRYLDELSGGEYQTVVIARALAQETGLLLLDEPTNNLDPANQQQVMRLVRQAVDERGLGALAVMHDINLALRYCDRFVFMEEGCVAASGGLEVVTAEEVARIYSIDAEVLDHKGTKVVIPV